MWAAIPEKFALHSLDIKAEFITFASQTTPANIDWSL
jgi:hypothetical protein